MMTLGWIFYNEIDKEKIIKSKIKDFDFVREKDDPYKIKAPMFTHKELREINSKLPKINDINDIKIPGIIDSDIEAYSRIYRYYPSFMEIVLG